MTDGPATTAIKESIAKKINEVLDDTMNKKTLLVCEDCGDLFEILTVDGICADCLSDQFLSDDDEDDDEDNNYDGDIEYAKYTGNCPWSLEFLNQDIIEETKSSDNWKTLWPNAMAYKKTDPAMEAANFYLLFGIINHSFVEFEHIEYPTDEQIEAAGKLLNIKPEIIDDRKKWMANERKNNPQYKLSEITNDANQMFVDLVERLDKCFKDYAHLACGGELRHHAAMKSSTFYKGSRRSAWAKWYYIYNHHGVESLKEMSRLFLEIKGGSIGGEPWAQASDILYARETMTLGPDEFTTKQLFVDRMFTLEHNNGSFLNKLNWANNRKTRQDANKPYGCMKETVLAAHCSNPTDINVLYAHANIFVQDLVTTYFETVNELGLNIVGLWGSSDISEQKNESVTTSTPPVSMIDWEGVCGKCGSVSDDGSECDCTKDVDINLF